MQRRTALDPRSRSDRVRREQVGRTLASTVWTTVVLATTVGAAIVLSVTAAAAGPTNRCEEVRVAEVSGLLDPVLVDFVEQTVVEAEACGAVAVFLQVDSGGAVVSDRRLDELVRVVEDAGVPVTV